MENPKSLFSSPENGRQHPLRDALRRNGKSDDKECNVSVMDENRREWMITLYDLDSNGKITRENMLSLMQTICEAVEASVKRLVLSNGTSLRVKLSVTPLPSRKDGDAGIQSLNERDHMKEAVRGLNSDQLGVLEKKHYSVDENTERRNHYLDLAGIKNYTSRIEETCAEELPQDIPARGHHRRSQPETCSPVESSGKPTPLLRSLRSRSKSVGYSGATKTPSKLHGHHPMTWCHPSHQQPLLHSSSKRMRGKARDTASPSRSNHDRDVQRHEHHHHHHHHHHHQPCVRGNPSVSD